MDEITARINEITEEAGNRMKLASYSPHQVYAEIMFMTDAEFNELHELKTLLRFDGAKEAKKRISEKINNRRICSH